MSHGLFLLVGSALLAIAPAVAQRAEPPPPEAATEPPPPRAAVDRLEELIWRGAAAANTASAYATYLNRYPDGPHAGEAKAAAEALRGAPPPAEAAAPASALAAPIAGESPVPSADPAPFVCRPAFAGEAPFEQAADAEIAAYLQAVRINSLGAYQTYLQAYPRGVFAPEVAEAVAARQGRMSALASLGGAGPTPARAHGQVAPREADYPSIALREAQQGTATAIWEIAEDGCVEACRIDKPSGAPALDAATCRIITLRGRYDPALDARGKPIRSIDSATFTWRLPQH